MGYRVKKFTTMKLAGLIAVLLLAACSGDQRYKRQVSGDETYLKTADLRALHAPAGITLPPQNESYVVPPVTIKGPVGKQLDIRPPAQPLAVINGSRAQFGGDTGTLILENNPGNTLWSQIQSTLQANHIPLTSQQESKTQVTTDWVQWNREDEDQQYRGRYQIALQPQGHQQILSVRLLQLQQNGHNVTSPVEIQRYTAQMLNMLAVGLDKATTTQNRNANGSTGAIDVQSGADDTGLPVVILRAPFAMVWQRLPATLQKAGMKVTDSDRSKGSMAVSYHAADATFRDKAAMALPDGKYQLQAGDLNNRTSLQFTSAKGQVLTQAQNDALVLLLRSVLSS